MKKNKHQRVKKALVAGAGGFIGSYLVIYLKKKGFWVRGVDIKKPDYEDSSADEFYLLDLRIKSNASKAVSGVDYVFNLAANMGGMGYIPYAAANIMHDNILIDLNLLEASANNNIRRFFYPSSALVYPDTVKRVGLKESDAYPANPNSEYGWEKLFVERLCKTYYENKGLETRIARFHNIYGSKGTWDGGRERVVAAICRKVAKSKEDDEIEVWGDGKQLRSFCHIRDCIRGIYKLTMSDIRTPLNIGSSKMVEIDQLVEMIIKISGKNIKIKHNLSKPQGVRARNSNNKLIKQYFNWEPSILLEKGLKENYLWIEKQVEGLGNNG